MVQSPLQLYTALPDSIAKEDFDYFLDTLGNRFIAGGDYNAKHTQWGSRLITVRGKNLLNSIISNNLNYLTTYEPTYWPTDTNKIPDLLDFLITKNISSRHVQINSSVDLSSDHSPVIVTISSTIIENTPNGSIHNQHTNWQLFREIFSHTTSASTSLKTNEEIEAATEYLNTSIINAIRFSTPAKTSISKHEYPQYNNDYFHKYLSSLSATADTNYSLWKASRKLTRPPQIIPPIRRPQGRWARSPIEKANLFAKHLSEVFKPHSSVAAADVTEYLHTSFQMSPPIEPFTSAEIIEEISRLNPKKAAGHELIGNKAIKKLPIKGIALIASIFNAILRLQHFPKAWKISLITLIPKPGKPIYETTSYRPISLLPTLSKLFERMLMNRLLPLLEEFKTLPDHQFGFRKQHSTVEQIHRITHIINQTLERKNTVQRYS